MAERDIRQQIDDRRNLRSAYQQGTAAYAIESIHDLRMTPEFEKLADKMSSSKCDGDRFALVAHVGGEYYNKDPEGLQWPAWGVNVLATGSLPFIDGLWRKLRGGGCAGTPTGKWPTRFTIMEMKKWTEWPPTPNSKSIMLTGDKMIDDLLRGDMDLIEKSDALMMGMEDAGRDSTRTPNMGATPESFVAPAAGMDKKE